MAIVKDFTFYIGEDADLVDTIYEQDGITIQNITGWSIQFVLHQTNSEVTLFSYSTAQGGVTITDGANGVLTVDIEGTDTSGLPEGNYVYKIARSDPGAITILTTGTLTLRAS